MTKVQRAKHISAIESILENNGFTLNRYNKYQKDNIKVDTRETNIKVVKGDFKIFSKPMTSLTLEEIQPLINKWERR